TFLADEIRKFRDKEKLILGICNGFQVILKAGLLIPPDEDGPLATLAHNTHGRFEDRWIHMTTAPGRCVWLKDIEQMHLPSRTAKARLSAARSGSFGAWPRRGRLCCSIQRTEDSGQR